MSAGLEIDQRLRTAVARGVAPAIAFGVARGEAPMQGWFAGTVQTAGHAAPVTDDTRFDLASLTKPLTTATWILRLVEQGRLDLERPIGAVIDVADTRLARTPLWRLLNHTAGLPAHRRYFAGLGRSVQHTGHFERSRAAVRRMLAATELERAPGDAEVYSDLGFLLLEWLAEAVDATLAERWIELPGHGPDALHFRPQPSSADAVTSRYAPTERCALRGGIIRAVVHDENAWVLGGIAGHAGLFGNLRAVVEQGRRWLHALGGDDTALGIGADLARTAIDRGWMHPKGTRVLGWDTPTPGRSSAGTGFGRRAIGHLGFTGTSIWLDPDAGVVMVLLTNRVHPSRDNIAIRRLRPQIHDAGWRWLRNRFT